MRKQDQRIVPPVCECFALLAGIVSEDYPYRFPLRHPTRRAFLCLSTVIVDFASPGLLALQKDLF